MDICLVQLIAMIRGYQIPVGYCTRALVCSLARMGGDSLSYFNILNFHSQCQRTMKMQVA